MTNAYKYLIEVAMPVREVSAESVRDKSIRHGHISTLHLWWARRPLPVCRAVVFASLVPDPDDPHCPTLFQEAVNTLLGPQPATTTGGRLVDPYRPYEDIPYTSAIDPVPDTLRNRLLTFIGKYSDTFIANEKAGRPTASGLQISEHSLIKWDNKNNETILGIARKLIWVAHNAASTHHTDGVDDLLADFDTHYAAIKTAERDLYQTPDRHLDTAENDAKEARLKTAIDAFLDQMPRVFDPFAGGGAIPLEAARLGCRTFGNDINPVAHIIQRGSLEFPQRYGKPITYSRAEFERFYGADTYLAMQQQGQVKQDGSIHLKNRLSHDVAFYAKRLLKEAEAAVGQYYPTVNGRKPIAYYWTRVGTCANPSCRAEVPLLKQFYLSKKRTTTPNNYVYLKPIIVGKQINFEICNGSYSGEGWVVSRKSLKCPVCGNATSNAELKQQFLAKTYTERLLAVAEDSAEGKNFRIPTDEEKTLIESLPKPDLTLPEQLAVGNTKQFDLCLWGFTTMGDMFSTRQLLTLQALIQELNKLKEEWGGKGPLLNLSGYRKAILAYLAIWIDRIVARGTSFGVWHILQETVEHPFGRQAIPMVFDYPELNPFSTNTGAAMSQLSAVLNYIQSESDNSFHVDCRNASSGDVHQFESKYINTVVTDPPYYDAIAYADLSDFFYAWLKRTVGDIFPLSAWTELFSRKSVGFKIDEQINAYCHQR